MHHPTPKAFARYPLILREPGSGTRAIVERALRKAGISPNAATPPLSLGSAEAIKSAVLANAGVAILSKLTVAFELRTGQLISLPIPALHVRRDLYHLHPRGLTPSHAATAFLALLHKTSPLHTPRRHEVPPPKGSFTPGPHPSDSSPRILFPYPASATSPENHPAPLEAKLPQHLPTCAYAFSGSNHLS